MGRITWNVLGTLCWCQGDKQSCLAGPPDGCVGNVEKVGGFCKGCLVSDTCEGERARNTIYEKEKG